MAVSVPLHEMEHQALDAAGRDDVVCSPLEGLVHKRVFIVQKSLELIEEDDFQSLAWNVVRRLEFEDLVFPPGERVAEAKFS